MNPCGWCITGDHKECKSFIIYYGKAFFCDCECKKKEERDAIKQSDAVRSRLQQWKDEESRLGNVNRRRRKRREPSGNAKG